MQFPTDSSGLPVSNRQMRESCSSSEIIAAMADGRLADDEREALLAHFSECEDCRREASLLQVAQPASTMPPALRDQIKHAVAGALERISTCRMTPACPDTQAIAAQVESTLTPDESASLLDHAAACDECRRELAIVALRRHSAPAPVPAPVQMRVKHAVSSTFERGSSRRLARIARPRPVLPFVAAAAAILVAAIAAAIVLRPKPPDEPVVRNPKREAPRENPAVPTPDIKQPVAPTERIEWPPVLPDAPIDEPAITHKPEPPKPEEPKNPVVDKPKDPDPKPDEPRQKPSETVALKFSPVTLTDVGGEVYIKRKDKKDKEKVSGIISVGDGDVLMAEKLTAFFLLGDFPIALMPKTTVTVAFEKETHAPALMLEQGEALIDSSAGKGSKWIVSNASVSLILDKTRAKFSASTDGRSLAVTALSESITGRDTTGRTFSIRSGERMNATDLVSKADPKSGEKLKTMGIARPTERTLFVLDRTVQPIEGLLKKDKKPENNYLLSVVDGTDATQQLVRVATKVGYQPYLVVRLKVVTRMQVVRVSLDVETRQGVVTLYADVKVGRQQLGKPITLDVPFEDFLVPAGSSVMITRERDKVVSVSVMGSKKDLFGDADHAIRLDDLTIVEPNP